MEDTPIEVVAMAIPILFMLIAGTIAVVCIIAVSIKGAVVSGQVEISRRELAAYVAEGSITPSDAERLLNAGAKHGKGRACGTRRGRPPMPERDWS